MTVAEKMRELAQQGAENTYHLLLEDIETVASNHHLFLKIHVNEAHITLVEEMLEKDGFDVKQEAGFLTIWWK